jgi:tRNA modification GTPase
MMYPRHEEAIIAQCTPTGPGAIALLRLTGVTTREIITQCTKLISGACISSCASHTIHTGWITEHDGTHIDQVLFLVMHGPRTFTGQDTVEITCHNNPFIIESIITRVIACGARIADRGEFTQRAYINKKIDLLQAEAINELIHAPTQEALKKSLAQLEGSFSSWVLMLQEKLTKIIVLCEASFEFNEDDIQFDHEIRATVTSLINDIEHVEASYHNQRHIKEGVRIALIGAVNAGKSSLFNALLKQDRAIVTDIPGTTRDVIEASLYTNQSYITFVDTAGLRHTHDHIEQEGIKRSFQEARKADIILLAIDSSQPHNQEEIAIYEELYTQHKDKIIYVATKSDIGTHSPLDDKKKYIRVSAKTDQNISELNRAITHKVEQLMHKSATPFLINKRHAHALQRLKKDLIEITHMTEKTIEAELVSVHARDALERVSQLSGQSITQHALDEIFKQFCVGK